MMKLRELCANPLKWGNNSSTCRLIKVPIQYPTRALTTSNDDTLYRRLLSARRNSNVSVATILEEWVKEEGIDVNRKSLLNVINQFKRSRDFNLALQICQWMNAQKCLGSSATYVQVQLDLITKVHGLKQAEQYFDSLPKNSRDWHGYIVLLNCYAKKKQLEKAEAAMQKLRELSYAKPLAYNILLGLYSQLKMHAKLESLVQEMEEKDIRDEVTYNIRLNICVTSSNMAQMEELLMKMEVDPLVTMNWKSYSIAVNGYLCTGAMEKAFATLRKAEHLISADRRNSTHDFLLPMYARMGKKDDVYRVWILQKENWGFSNKSYLCMMSALVMLDDLDGAQKIFEEWEAVHTYFEHQLPNFLIGTYCRKGLLEKAETILNRLIKSGKKPNVGAWSHMAVGYHEVNLMDKVVETTKEAILASHPGWRPNFSVLAASLNYLEGKGDVVMAKKILRLIQEKAHLTTSSKKLLKYWRERELAQRLHATGERTTKRGGSKT